MDRSCAHPHKKLYNGENKIFLFLFFLQCHHRLSFLLLLSADLPYKCANLYFTLVQLGHKRRPLAGRRGSSVRSDEECAMLLAGWISLLLQMRLLLCVCVTLSVYNSLDDNSKRDFVSFQPFLSRMSRLRCWIFLHKKESIN